MTKDEGERCRPRDNANAKLVEGYVTVMRTDTCLHWRGLSGGIGNRCLVFRDMNSRKKNGNRPYTYLSTINTIIVLLYCTTVVVLL